MADWFDDIKVIGALPREEQLRRLEAQAAPPAAPPAPPPAAPPASPPPPTAPSFGARPVEMPRQSSIAPARPAPPAPAAPGSTTREAGRGGFLSRLFGGETQAWQHTGHTFGYIAPLTDEASAPDMLDIQQAGNVSGDPALRGARINVTLDRLRVADYPGDGTHEILVNFIAEHSTDMGAEKVQFDGYYSVGEGQMGGFFGYPIFRGLTVGRDGVAFSCMTINLNNQQDKKMLGFLESETFKAGLELVTTFQPAVRPLSEIAMGLTKSVLTRTENVAVQKIYMGLDFSQIPLRARLRVGSYIAVQIPDTQIGSWDWREYGYARNTGQIVRRNQPGQMIPYNYFVFSIDRYHEDTPAS